MTLVRHYEITLDGSTVPIHVAVPFQEDERLEEYTAIMFAREQAGRYSHRMLRSSQRGELLSLKESK